MSSNSKRIALIDGYGFIFRAFHSLPPLTRADGTPVGAVYGFTNMLIKLLANLEVSHIAVVFDSGSKTFRNDLFPAYKANRPPCPEELKPQFSIVREVAEALNLTILERVGFEADDLIATVATQASEQGFDVLIVSSDKDFMQLVDDSVTMYDSLKNKMITAKEVEEKFFVKPSQVLDVLSLMGDASDNVPGVRGIGPKTAAELINKYNTLENLLENLDEIPQEKRRQILKDGIENAKLSKRLITLCKTVPVSDNLEDYLLQHIDGTKLVGFLERQGFRALVTKVKKDFDVENIIEDQRKEENLSNKEVSKNSSNNSFDQVKTIIVSDILEIKTLCQKAVENGNLVVDLVLENNAAKVLILSSSADLESIKEVFYVDIADIKNEQNYGDLFAVKTENISKKKGLDLDILLKELLPILLDDSVNKIGYKVKDLMKFLDIKNGVDDVALMAYVLNSGADKADLDVLVADNLQDEVSVDFSTFCQEIEKSKIPEKFFDEGKKIQFYCFKNYCLWQLFKKLKQRVFEENLNNVYYGFEKPLIGVLARIEKAGIAIDELKLKQLSSDFSWIIQQLSKEIYQLADEEFNIGSPKQMATVLFEKLSFKTGKKSSKTGAFSTNSEVLEELDLEGHIIAGKILEWRHFSKLKSTYADALQNAINTSTKRIHTTLLNMNTSTGRLSSNNPNLQNIPIRSEEGRKIRSAFIAEKGTKLISADYSQIELRVLADIAGIDTLKKAFLLDKDIHTITAAQVFGVPENEVDKEMRRKAKAINFGIIYGISAFGLAKQLKIPRQDAARYIEEYFKTYPGIQKYMQNYQELARQDGFVKTIIGRKCFIPTINSKNPTLRGLAERLAINAPIQGSAADIIKKAMIDFDQVLLNSGFKSKMVLQVHDELLVEAPENEVDLVVELLKKTMEKAILLDVPLKVDVKVDSRWS